MENVVINRPARNNHSAQNANRLPCRRICAMIAMLAPLGLCYNDTRRLAHEIDRGANDLSPAEYAARLEYACRTTTYQDGELMIRVVMDDLVVFGPHGYVVIDYVPGEIEFVHSYGAGATFESMTGPYAI